MSINDDETLPGAKTSQLPAVSPMEVMLRQMQISMEANFREMGANIQLVSNDLGIVKDRVGVIESWKNDQDTRAARTSARVQQASSAGLEHEAQLAQERMAREALATKVDDLSKTNDVQLAILARLDKITSNPQVKLILAVISTAFLSWAASKGFR